jgi:RNA 3'-terminal phosphate cyclase
LRSLTAFSTVSDRLPEHIVGRQMTAALKDLPHDVSRRAKRVGEQPPGGPGTQVVLAAEFEAGFAGASALGERGKPAEAVGAEAAKNLIAFLDSGAAADAHLADQLLLYAALAEGDSVILAHHSTGHLRTNAWVIGQFLDAGITITGEAPARIQVSGAGILPPNRREEPSPT